MAYNLQRIPGVQPDPQTHFTLIGYPTLVFQVIERGLYFQIDCVHGGAIAKPLETLARVADVNFHDAYAFRKIV